jgi:hypothetical protein
MPPTSRFPKKWKPPEDDKKSVIFVRSELDDYGLDVYEFRVLAHVARQEERNKLGKSKGCYARQKTIAETCLNPRQKVWLLVSLLKGVAVALTESQLSCFKCWELWMRLVMAVKVGLALVHTIKETHFSGWDRCINFIDQLLVIEITFLIDKKHLIGLTVSTT